MKRYLNRLAIGAAAALIFACAPSKQFCPADYSVDFVEASRFAEKARLAYEPDSVIREACGPDSCFLFTGRATKAKVFLQRNDSTKVQWLAFRGTQGAYDVKSDARFTQARDTVLEMHFHRGFAAVAGDLYPEFSPLLNPEYRTMVTGHSLGGAVAVITALRLKKVGYSVSVYTFGQPKVTNGEGVKLASSLPLTRFIHGKDLVALVPPISWKPGKDLGTYSHFGREVALQDQGYECLEEHFSKRHDPSSWWEQAQKQAVADHLMDNYVTKLRELADRQAAAGP